MNFTLQVDSPCIDAGDPSAPYDSDGSVSDIAAIPFISPCGIFGDLNADNTVDILDLLLLVNLILAEDFQHCADQNLDGNLDILDALALVNLILEN